MKVGIKLGAKILKSTKIVFVILMVGCVHEEKENRVLHAKINDKLVTEELRVSLSKSLQINFELDEKHSWFRGGEYYTSFDIYVKETGQILQQNDFRIFFPDGLVERENKGLKIELQLNEVNQKLSVSSKRREAVRYDVAPNTAYDIKFRAYRKLGRKVIGKYETERFPIRFEG